MKQKREVISVWPINHECNIRGLVKITFGESISIFPLKLIEGKAYNRERQKKSIF